MNETDIMPNYRRWTEDLFLCYQRGYKCKGCPIGNTIKTLESAHGCKLKHVAHKLITKGIEPPAMSEFGETVQKSETRSRFTFFKAVNHYGNAANADKCCKHCKFRTTKKIGNRIYHKCTLMGVSNSSASDIRLTAVCDRFTINKTS